MVQSNSGPDADLVSDPEAEAIQSFAELWHSKCGDDSLPARSDFPAEELRPWMGNLILMDVVDDGRDFRYRLVGTDIVRIVGRDLTGRRVSECDYEGGRDHVLSSFNLPIEKRCPVFRRGRVTWRSRKSYLDYESVHCPLRTTGAAIDMTIGVQIYTDRYLAS